MSTHGRFTVWTSQISCVGTSLPLPVVGEGLGQGLLPTPDVLMCVSGSKRPPLSSIRTPVLLRSGPPIIRNDVCEEPISESSPVLRSRGLGLPRKNLGRHSPADLLLGPHDGL